VAGWQCLKRVRPKPIQSGQMERRLVRSELHRSNWIRSLSSINTTTQIEKFSLLFMVISSVQLSDKKIESYGNGPQMVNTRWPRPMIVSSLEVTLISRLQPSGKHSQSPSVNSMLCWFSITGSLLQTICQKGPGLVTKCLPSVSNLKRLLITC
jgi:hypothetical protein